MLARCGYLHGDWSAGDAPRAVVAGASGSVIDDGVVNRCVGDGSVVDLDVVGVHVVDSAVVVEAVSIPIAALVTGAGIAISIINAAVVANVSAPIAVVVTIAVTAISPPSGSPQIARFRRAGPCSGNPVVTL